MIFIAGATGFVGGHLVSQLQEKGLDFRCLARTEKAAQSFKKQGIGAVTGDVTLPDTIRGVLDKGDFVVHLVGIIEEKKGVTFRSVHVEGTANLIKEAKSAGAAHFFYQSALGSDINSWSGYLKTKAEAERLVIESGLPYTIFRPSLIIGPWDGFTKKILDMLKLSPVIPMPGEGKAMFQPVFISDWVKCVMKVIENPADFVGIFDIGGPEHLSYREMVGKMAIVAEKQRPVLNLPMSLVKFGAALSSTILSSPPVTTDQLRLLEQDNICAIDVIEKSFGFRPIRFEDALREFLHQKSQ